MALIRDIHPDTLAAIGQRGFHPALLVFVDWPSDPAYAHTGVGVIEWGGHDWQGVGGLGGVDLPDESTGSGAAADAVLSLVAPAGQLVALLGRSARNADVRVWWAAVTAPQGNTLIGAPVELFSGFVTANEFDVGEDGEGQGVRFALSVTTGESVRLPMSDVHSPEDQQARHPGDTFFEHGVFSAHQRRNPPRW